jgi:hypothetical protein
VYHLERGGARTGVERGESVEMTTRKGGGNGIGGGGGGVENKNTDIG